MTETGSNIQRACMLLVQELYKHEPCGGDLHIVTDDGNIEDGALEWCESYILRNGKAETAIGRLELAILRLLRLMTLDEREIAVGERIGGYFWDTTRDKMIDDMIDGKEKR